MSVAEQFAGLDMKSLIGGPLTAAADASILLARSTADFINDVGFDANGKVRTAAFGYSRRSANDDGTSNLEEMKVDVPMLAIVPIPNLQIDEVNILFDMEVKQSEKSEKSMDLGATLSGSAKFGPIKVNITGSVSAHSSNTRSSDNSAKYHVDVRATNHGTPEGLSRVLDMMSVCISPMLLNSELKDGNGQNLTDTAKADAERLKQLRSAVNALEGQLDAARNGLESNIQRMKNIANSQQNIYQAAVTRLLGNLKQDSSDYEEKSDLYSESMSEVNQAWTNFRNQAADLIKLASDSDDTKAGISELFGLKAFKSDDGKVTSYTSAEAQYAALERAEKDALAAQKRYDEIEANLLAKKSEYNDAISGKYLSNAGKAANEPAKPAGTNTPNSNAGTGGTQGKSK